MNTRTRNFRISSRPTRDEHAERMKRIAEDFRRELEPGSKSDQLALVEPTADTVRSSPTERQVDWTFA